MPLLKQAMKYGGIAYAAKSLSKGISAHQEAKTKEQTPYYHTPPEYSISQSGGFYQQGPGYVHQVWCDGSCRFRCCGA